MSTIDGPGYAIIHWDDTAISRPTVRMNTIGPHRYEPLNIEDSIRNIRDRIETLLQREESDNPQLNRFISLKGLLDSPDLTLPKINWLLSHATPSIYSLGTRSIQIDENEFSGNLPLSDIAKSIRSFAWQKDRLNLSLRDCTAGVQCVRKMRGFYKTTDAVIQGNCITRTTEVFRNFIKVIKQIFFGVKTIFFRGTPYYNLRDEIECGEERDFGTFGPFDPEQAFSTRMCNLSTRS